MSVTQRETMVNNIQENLADILNILVLLQDELVDTGAIYDHMTIDDDLLYKLMHMVAGIRASDELSKLEGICDIVLEDSNIIEYI